MQMLLAVLKLNKNIILQTLNQANQNDKIEIRIFNKPIGLIKRYINYKIQDKTLIIDDKYKNEQYIININSIKLIKFIAPKRIGMTWFDSEINANSEVENKMSI